MSTADEAVTTQMLKIRKALEFETRELPRCEQLEVLGLARLLVERLTIELTERNPHEH